VFSTQTSLAGSYLHWKDPGCVFGHTCKCNLHKKMGAALVGEFFSVLKKSGNRTLSCLHVCASSRTQHGQKKAELTKVDYLFFRFL